MNTQLPQLVCKTDVTADGYGFLSIQSPGITIEYGILNTRTWPLHAHPEHQLLILPENTCEAALSWQCDKGATKRAWIRGAHICIIPRLVPHELYWARPGAIISLRITDDFILHHARGGASLNVLVRNEWEFAKTEIMIHDLDGRFARICHHKESQSPGFIHSLGIVQVTNILKANQHPLFAHSQSGLSSMQMQKIEQHIAENLCNGAISIKILASIAGVGADHFRRLFRTTTGVVPREYVIKKRIQRAQHLMHDEDALMSEIAAEAGFTDQSHMAKCIRRFCGQCKKSRIRPQKNRKRPIQPQKTGT